jgi:single-strand DNA-binding protein
VRDAEKKVIPTGSTLVSFDIANNTGWGDNKKVTYITVNMWGKSGEGVFPYLKKGGPIAVTGELEMQKWVGKVDGAEHQKLVLNCNRLTLLGAASATKVEEPPSDVPWADAIAF